MPAMASIPIPGGVVQTLRQLGGIYVETWFMGTPVVMVTLPVQLLYLALLIGACMLVVIEYWLLWRLWKRDTVR